MKVEKTNGHISIPACFAFIRGSPAVSVFIRVSVTIKLKPAKVLKVSIVKLTANWIIDAPFFIKWFILVWYKSGTFGWFRYKMRFLV